jgi:hypothetical protein
VVLWVHTVSPSIELGLGRTNSVTGWFNITLVLNEADVDFDKTMTLTGATSSGMETTDGGKTWTIDEIVIEKQNLTEAS